MSALELGKYVHRGLAHKRVVLIQCQSWAAVLCEVAEIRYWQTDIQTKYCNHRCACVCVCVCVCMPSVEIDRMEVVLNPSPCVQQTHP